MLAIVETDQASTPIRQAVTHWRQMCGSDGVPSRYLLDPLDIASLLPNTELIDVVENGSDFRYRLIGDVIFRNGLGHHLGKLVSEIPTQRPPSQIYALYRETVRRQQPVSARLPYVGPSKLVKDLEIAALPLSTERRTVGVLWSVVVPNELD